MTLDYTGTDHLDAARRPRVRSGQIVDDNRRARVRLDVAVAHGAGDVETGRNDVVAIEIEDDRRNIAESQS